MIEENNTPQVERDELEATGKGVSYSAAFFMLIAFGVGCTILSGVIAIPLVSLMSGKSIAFVTQHLQEMVGNKAYLREIQVLQSLSAIIGFLVPTLFVASRINRRPLALTGFKGAISAREVGLVILIMACGLALSSALGYFTYKLPFPVNWRIVFDRLEHNYAETAAGIISFASIPDLIISIIVLALVPAVCEETFFRGGLQNYLYRSTGKLWMSVIVVSVIFSAVHFSVYGFLSRVALGIVLGLIFQYSGRLWLSILAHFLNNTTAVIMMYVQTGKGKTLQEVLNDRDGSYWGLAVVPVIIYLFIEYRKSIAHKTTASNGF
jgi:Predicted metal-dependent membrane protease